MTEAPARPIRLLRSFATVGSWTMASRVLGFVRDAMIAALLGAGPAADAFFVAFRLPNMFRRFFAEGAFNMAFVPLFSKRLEAGEDARGFAEEALAGLSFILLLITAAALVFMPALVFLLAAGFADDPARFDPAVLYGRIQFPYLLCMALTALFSGVLNALGRFAAPAAAPLLLNGLTIASMGFAASTEGSVGAALSVGVLASGFAQVWLVAWAARREGFSLRLRQPRWTPAMRRLVRLGVPGVLAGGVAQINILVGTMIASFFAGAVSWLSYADRLYQLPLGVVGVAIGVVLLPELSRRAAAGDMAGARDAFCRAAEFSLILTLPATAGLAALAEPLSAVLFGRGAFSAEDVDAVGAATLLYALGLPAYVLQRVVQPAFFAREDTRTPLRCAMVSVAVNTAISAGGAPLFGWLAIPVGTAVAGWLNLWMLWRAARRFGDATAPDERLRARAPLMVASSLIMAAALLAGAWRLDAALSAPGLRYLALFGLVLAGGAIYFAAAFGLGAVRMTDLRAGFRKGRR